MVEQITEKGWNTAFFITDKDDAEADRIKILKYILDHGLHVNHVSESGKTILVNARINDLNNIEQLSSQKIPVSLGTTRQISFE